MVETFAAWAGIEESPVVLDSLRSAWTLHPYMQDGEVRAIACMSDAEIHFAVAPQWRHRLIQRNRTREFLAPLFDLHGFLVTRSDPDAKHRKFLERIGFSFTWNDGKFNHFMMHELPFGKKGN